jgi:hypothetical protein
VAKLASDELTESQQRARQRERVLPTPPLSAPARRRFTMAFPALSDAFADPPAPLLAEDENRPEAKVTRSKRGKHRGLCSR